MTNFTYSLFSTSYSLFSTSQTTTLDKEEEEEENALMSVERPYSENGETVGEVSGRLQQLLAKIGDSPVAKPIIEVKQKGLVLVLEGHSDPSSFEYYSRKAGQHLGPTQGVEDRILKVVERVLDPRFLSTEVYQPPSGIDGDYRITERYRTVFPDVWLRKTKCGASSLVSSGVGEDVSWEITRQPSPTS